MEKVAIIGVGDTMMGNSNGHSTLELQTEAAMKAIRDAGLEKRQIDGLIVAPSVSDNFMMPSMTLADYMGLTELDFSTSLALGGIGPCAMVQQAMMAINAGLCSTVLIVGGEARISTKGRKAMVESLRDLGGPHPQYEVPFGSFIPASYALIAQRHMFEYGTTSEDLASVAVTQREHAMKNPNAQFRKPLTIDDVLNSKLIATPLHLFDCAAIADGAAAVVVTTKGKATSMSRQAAELLGWGEGHTHEYISSAPSLTTMGCLKSGRQAFKRAGVKPKDIDAAMLYDCFTITVLIELEDLGFCEKGEAGKFARSGEIALGGRLPVNTHGGLLSCGHSGGGIAVAQITEAVKQLRNEAGERQVKDAELVCVHGNSGIMSAHSTLILGKM
jgi:acetyl-CoA acetyltransferase